MYILPFLPRYLTDYELQYSTLLAVFRWKHSGHGKRGSGLRAYGPISELDYFGQWILSELLSHLLSGSKGDTVSKQLKIEMPGRVVSNIASGNTESPVWSHVEVLGDFVVGRKDSVMLKAELPLGASVKVTIELENQRAVATDA